MALGAVLEIFQTEIASSWATAETPENPSQKWYQNDPPQFVLWFQVHCHDSKFWPPKIWMSKGKNVFRHDCDGQMHKSWHPFWLGWNVPYKWNINENKIKFSDPRLAHDFYREKAGIGRASEDSSSWEKEARNLIPRCKPCHFCYPKNLAC